MRRVVDIGRRIELIPIDPHFHDITIGLYRQQIVDPTTGKDSPAFLVHTYSHISGAAERIENVMQSMQILGGMLRTVDGLLYFPCNSAHEAACRRVFLEACKLAPNTLIEPRPLNILDKKSQLTITVDSAGKGIYRVTADSEGRGASRRISAIAGGLMKLGEMESIETDNKDTVAFACGQPHDGLIGLLLMRAPNVRVVLREAEMDASRGVLTAPSQQT
ncbi:hypothetical protein F4054_06345 [Candidatus Poribacteria bacterium]|nr:hypothetical protein [Candidatus Poribacteria bacterium]MYG08873.1 hypothetical protein [Candidatus Poribacteria bacterium]MYK21861.1 hypothetical protein [Candidatus Poribacteria bacterium]